MRLLVTGGAGFIGSNFIHHILQEHPQWEVTNLDKLTYAGNLENLKDIENLPRYRFVKGDIADRDLVDGLLSRGFDAVINFRRRVPCRPQYPGRFAFYRYQH